MTRMRTISLCTLSGLLAVGLAMAGCSSSNDSEDGGTDDGGSTMTATNGGSTTDTSGGATNDATSDGGTSTTGGGGGTIWTSMLPCGNTAAGVEIKKGTACTADDTAECWRSCGPESVGRKTETCTGGAYAEGDCQFDPGADHSCFTVPATVDASCPADPPQASQLCTVATCTPCNGGGLYLDSGGSQKEGYCVCREPNEDGESTWTCASTTAWPCPAGSGC